MLSTDVQGKWRVWLADTPFAKYTEQFLNQKAPKRIVRQFLGYLQKEDPDLISIFNTSVIIKI